MTSKFDSLNEEFNEEVAPVYVSKAVKEGNLWDNITSGEFWATEGADGIGYMASMFIPGAGLKALGVGGKLAKGMSSAGKFLSKNKAFKGAENLSKLRDATGGILDFSAKGMDVMSATAINTVIEAGAETSMAARTFDDELDAMYNNGEITEAQYNARKANKNEMMKDVFMGNVAVLTAPTCGAPGTLIGQFDSSNTTSSAITNNSSPVGLASASAIYLSEAFSSAPHDKTI